METLAGVTPRASPTEMAGLDRPRLRQPPRRAWSNKPVLILSSDDGLGPMTDALAADIASAAAEVTTIHGATNHAWDSLRVRAGQRDHHAGWTAVPK